MAGYGWRGNQKSFKENTDNFFVKVRSTGELIKAKIKLHKNEAEINLEENETGISPGQACVFYSKNKLGDKVLGGGWIIKTVNKYLSTQPTWSNFKNQKQLNSDLNLFLFVM